MKTVLRLELVADELFLAAKHNGLSFHEWLRFVMRLGPDKSPTSVIQINCDGTRKEIRCYRDYEDADRTGNRGVIGHFALDPGLYDVTERTDWRTVEHYQIRVENGNIKRGTA